MRTASLTPSSLLKAIGLHVRQSRAAARRARLERELSRLPRYIARDIGAGSDQDRFVNVSD
jgi:hypothetical protein